MSIKKISKTLILLLTTLFFFTNQALTYDNLIVHPKLTRKSVKLYNQKSPNKELSTKQERWIVEGAIAEDTDPRYLNHFYNPKTREGLSDGPFSGHSAKWWAYNQDSVSGDYSVPTILENYKKGNKKRAYQGVGHILHLLQDMTVPAHVRNDAHPEGDPYEGWLKKKNPISGNNFKVEKINNPGKAFDFLANFTHDNFYSKDTIKISEKKLSLFNKIEKERDGKLRIYYENKIGSNKYKILYNKNPNSINPKYGISGDVLVNYDYWKQLYPKAIGYSAGVIDYFDKEFEKIDQKQEKEKDLGFFQGLKNKISEGASDLWGESKYAFGDNALATRKKVDSTYEAGKEKVDATKKWTVLFSQSFAEVAIDGAEYAVDKTNDTWEWSKSRIAQGYDAITGAENGEKEENKIKDEKENKSNKKDDNTKEQKVLAVKEEKEGDEEDEIEAQPEPQPTKEQEPDQEQDTNEQKGRVVGVKFVYDGDTILLESGEKVRYLGMDTPELNDAGPEDDDCMAWEAKNRNMKILEADTVTIRKDPGVNKDKYGRLLRYVYADGEFINKQMVREGLAEPFFCRPGWENCAQTENQQVKKDILEAHKKAKSENLGIYSPDCIFHNQDKQVASRDTEDKEKNKKKERKQKDESEKEKEQEKNKENPSTSSGRAPSTPSISSGQASSSSAGSGQAGQASSTQKKKLNIHVLSGGESLKDKNNKEENSKKDDKTKEIKPPKIKLTKTPAKLSSSTRAKFAIQTENASTSKIYLDDKKISTATNSTSSVTFNSLEEGEHKFTTTASNTSKTASTSFLWKIDRTAQIPEITNIKPQNGTYWINESTVKLKGYKAPDIKEITLIASNSPSSTTMSFSTSSDKTDWEALLSFDFECLKPKKEIRALSQPDLLYERIGCLQGKGFGYDRMTPEGIKDFYTRKIKLRVKDELGNVATSSDYVFTADNLAPRIYYQDIYYSEGNNHFYSSFSLMDELGDIGEKIPFPLTNSGVESIDWRIKASSTNEWKTIKPIDKSQVESAGMTYDKYGFANNKSQKYTLWRKVKDYAGNITTSTQKIKPKKSHIVISELYIDGKGTSAVEWVELYNPKKESVELSGWTLDTKADSDADVTLPDDASIPPHGYYLISDDKYASTTYKEWPKPDYLETLTLTNESGWVRLRNTNEEIVDLVGWKYSSQDEDRGVGSHDENFDLDGKSLERKATYVSDKQKMTSGDHENKGNGWDSNHNAKDFIIRDNPDPQNSSSSPEKWNF